MKVTDTPTPPPSRGWLWIALIWLAFGLINGTQTVVGMRAAGMRHNWAALFAEWTFAWLIWASATPLVLTLGRRYPPTRSCGVRGWLIHLAACVAIGIADAFWLGTLHVLLKPMGDSSDTGSIVSCSFTFLFERFHLDLITYAAIVATGYAIDSLQRLAKREAELSQARLDALRRQLEPHFLFNTLNGIAGLIRDRQNDAAVEMIAGLSDLLRRVVEGSDRQLVTLAEELSFVERYIEIQAMRFGDRLKAVVDVPLELYGALVPNLILQPLVENAIVHGIAHQVDGGTIRVSASASDRWLTIRVHNDGPALNLRDTHQLAGVGLANTRGRLWTLYGSGCALEVRNHGHSGVETVVTVPYRIAP